MASREPVDAPDGTAARPITPLSSSTSHSTVGLPRLSRISRPTMSTMALIVFAPGFQDLRGRAARAPGALPATGPAHSGYGLHSATAAAHLAPTAVTAERQSEGGWPSAVLTRRPSGGRPPRRGA